ncbi:MAG: U32 family peptidase C-terminal domain-containing protein, partial [Bacilli bacterium]|nr:U32 family peptidase C-terminal domain-containing protein [Bacilli bacterium]
LLKYIHNLIDMGVVSFKVEGRMRSIYYIASVINIYRKAIDQYCDNPEAYEYNITYERELYRCANRDVVPQYFNKKPGVDEQYYLDCEEPSNQDFLGIVLEYDEKKKEVIIEQRNFFKIGDEVEIFGPQQPPVLFIINSLKEENGELIEVARHPHQIVRIPLPHKVNKDDLMRVKLRFDIPDYL